MSTSRPAGPRLVFFESKERVRPHGMSTSRPRPRCVSSSSNHAVSGYTIGYFGRPFEKKAGTRGGDFEGERDYSRFVVGKGEVVPALEEGVVGVKEGGVRQIIFPPELGYPMVRDRAVYQNASAAAKKMSLSFESLSFEMGRTEASLSRRDGLGLSPRGSATTD